ncbi:MAG: radical SAM protein [Campylobacteraceae bacterium]|jgi:DNA repair photolyase|nr:radical SAM protein [Campylobacteraceae bacterium]
MIKVSEIEVKNLISKSKIPSIDFAINPYVGCPHKCIYCYAEFMGKFHKEKWGNFLDVKICTKAINIEKFKNNTVFLSSVTDAYNPFEAKYGITKQVLEQFIASQVKVEILTKSNLVTRDVKILKQIPNISVGFSINTTDDVVRKQIEPYASSVQKRIDALKILHNEGINTWVFISPIFPKITDFKNIVDICRTYAYSFGFENLNLKNSYHMRVLNYIRIHHQNLLPLYQEIYVRNNKDYWQQTACEIHSYCQEIGIDYSIHFH